MFKSGFVAISGRPNVGKSTLLNNIIKQKVSIISPKAQTTRNTIRGIYNDEDAQIIFLDTPGIHKARNRLGEIMNASASKATKDTEANIFLVNAFDEVDEELLTLVKSIANKKIPFILVINKIDLVSKEDLLNKVVEWQTKFDFYAIVPLSAAKGENVERLISLLKDIMPEGPKYYPDNVMSDHPERFIIAELIREKTLFFTHEEVPHSIAVIIERIKPIKKNIIEINATIIVEKDSQKGIVIGNQGKMLKRIGSSARRDIENLLGSKIMLNTFVRVEKNWQNSQRYLREFGYRDE